MRRRTIRIHLFACAVCVLAAGAARAADLFVEAPDSCVEPSALADEVTDLVGRPLASVPGMDFHVRITHQPADRWRLHLEVVETAHPGGGAAEARSRDIDGASCAELGEAAAVAISVAVRSIGTEPMPTTDGAPATPASAPPRARPQPAAMVTSGPPTPTTAPTASPPWRPAVSLGVASETGALPSAGFGVELGADLQRGPLRLELLGSWLPARKVIGADNTGGSFQLALGAALACLAPRWGRLTPLACGGLELGWLWGTGIDVPRPQEGGAAWGATRADLGLAAALRDNLSLLLRATAARPVSRPTFVVDASSPVYQPSTLDGRLTLGIELGF